MVTRSLACDLGAESGRVMLGTLAESPDGWAGPVMRPARAPDATRGGACAPPDRSASVPRLALEEIHRFTNTPLKTADGLHWNIPELFAGIKAGLQKAARRGEAITSVSADSWGLDYMLFGPDGTVMPPTFHYRDERCARGVERARARVDWPTTFAETGIQFIPINAIYQLMAEAEGRLQGCRFLLGIGDGFNYLLSGEVAAEVSLASTFQLYNPVQRSWSKRLINGFGLPEAIFPRLVNSGTVLGPLKADLARETGLQGTQVIAGCSHDTGSAVVGVPASGSGWAYLSSGTWSLLGVERAQPIINDRCRELNFTNEIGYGNKVRLLKNIVGLWIVQECRREWASEGREYDYAALTEMAASAAPASAWFDASDPRFMAPGNMPGKIADCCREHGLTPPQGPGAVIRCVLESLARLYAATLDELEQLTGEKIERLHIVGGGSKNELLNQLTANATRRPVHAGPVEATAAGNILVQALAMGQLRSLTEAREVVARSFEVKVFSPNPGR